ncbi:MAG TPA: hypothetical protein VFV75_11950 [Candidatus Polarisedimenticolaceae bacterium]|nr:hypothetical protein [Candidatus Polarisedimenticolaceae bacterium]
MIDRSARTLLRSLLLGLATTASLAAGDGERAYAPQASSHGYTAANARQHLQAVFSADGLELSALPDVPPWSLRQQLRAAGTREALETLSPAPPSAHPTGVEYRHPGGLSERYVNTPEGLQQWFTVERAPREEAEGSPLVLDFALSGGLTFTVDGAGRALYGSDGPRGPAVTTRLWQVRTASGRAPYAELQATEDGFQLVTQVAEEDYPVTLALATGHPKTLDLRAETAVSSRTLTSSATAPAEPVEPLAAPANDTCAGAQVVPAAGPFPFLTTPVNLLDATSGGDPTIDCAFQGLYSRGVWYRFAPTQGGIYNFSTCAASAPGTTRTDTVLGVFTLNAACGNSSTQLACNDDGACLEPNDRQSFASLPLTAGTTYYIVVYSYDVTAPPANASSVQLRVERVPPPANETCAAAAPLSLGATPGTLLQGANDYSLSGTTCFSGVGNTSCTASGRDTVYQFTAPGAGNYSFRVRTLDPTGGGNLVLYSSPTCPGPSALTCDASRWAANRNTLTAQYAAAEEIVCQPMTAGQVTYLFVDECAAVPTGGAYSIEAWSCGQETESNGTPATANAFAACPTEGAIGTTGDVDFFSLGTPANNTRVFAMADGIQTNDADFDLRVTSATDTLEFDDANNSLPWGELGPNVAGTRLTGTASYLRVNHHTSSRVAEPYQLFRVLQPPGGDPYNSSSSPEQRDLENDTLEGAEAAGNDYYRGTLASIDDLDAFRFCAVAGDWITVGVDMDPGRNNTPINSMGLLYDQNGDPLVTMEDAAATGTSTTPGAGNLAATTPSSNGEAVAWRARYTGAYYAAAAMDPDGTGTLPASADYLVSIGVNCQSGAARSARLVTDLTGPVSVTAGSTFSYHVILSNTGTNTALGAAFTDVLPAGVQFLEVTGSGTDAGFCDVVPAVGSSGTLHCQVDCLRPGGSWDFNVVVRATSCQGNGSVANSVTATSLTALAGGSVLADNVSTTVTDDGTCDDGNACTVGDTCSAGACVSSPVQRPATIAGFAFTSKTAMSWGANVWATEYDLVRGGLSGLPVGPGGGDEVCLGQLPGTSGTDAAVPALGTGYWYLVRGQNACTSPGSYGNNGQGMQRVTSTCP